METAVAEQLGRRGIDVITAHETHPPGEDDMVLLEYATSVGRVMCTYDKHFVDIAKSGIPHAGIAYFVHTHSEIGYVVKSLAAMAEHYTADTMENRFEYL